MKFAAVLFSVALFMVSSLQAQIVHVVKKGETLSSISKKYNISYTKIKKLNNLKNNNIHVKQKLRIPSSSKKTKVVNKPTSNKKITKITKDIHNNEKKLKKESTLKSRTSIKVKLLAKQIKTQTNDLNQLDTNIKSINSDISEHEEELGIAKKHLNELQDSTSTITTKRTSNEKEIITTIIEQFSSSLALELASAESTNSLIDKEIYTILSQNSKDQIIKLDTNYLNLSQKKGSNEKKIALLKKYIKKSQAKKNKLKIMIKNQKKSLGELENKHKTYKVELKNIVKKQNNLKTLLGKLNIFKKDELNKQQKAVQKEQRRILALKKKEDKAKKKNRSKVVLTQSTQERLATNIDMDIRMLGSSTKGVRIAKYKGPKTTPPLKSYKIVKKFGTYYDPIYKIKLFNESIILKTKKPKAKVYNILNGKIVYAKKDSGMLENVVIVQHKNNLHTVYSHLDEISPTLREGKWIKKGYVVGRVNDTLTFQATKNNRHINPKDLFN
ncbi:MAG: LysM peptidoglycan-binding domain-containing protein [Campylobacterota bacterium]|nr:LysM peptidoglycan-binding domain-containing protein [Campylobacterota bacterium]